MYAHNAKHSFKLIDHTSKQITLCPSVVVIVNCTYVAIIHVVPLFVFVSRENGKL